MRRGDRKAARERERLAHKANLNAMRVQFEKEATVQVDAMRARTALYQ